MDLHAPCARSLPADIAGCTAGRAASAVAAPLGWPAAALTPCAPAGSSCAAAALGRRLRLQHQHRVVVLTSSDNSHWRRARHCQAFSGVCKWEQPSLRGRCAGGLGSPAGAGAPPFQLAPPHSEADRVDRLGREPSPSGSLAPLPPAPVHARLARHPSSWTRNCGHTMSGVLHAVQVNIEGQGHCRC